MSKKKAHPSWNMVAAGAKLKAKVLGEKDGQTLVEITAEPPTGLGTWVCERCATLRVMNQQVVESRYKYLFATCPDCNEPQRNQELCLVRAKREDEA